MIRQPGFVRRKIARGYGNLLIKTFYEEKVAVDNAKSLISKPPKDIWEMFDRMEEKTGFNGQFLRPIHLSKVVDILETAKPDNKNNLRYIIHAPPRHSKTSTCLLTLIYYCITGNLKGRRVPTKHAFLTFNKEEMRKKLRLFKQYLEILGVDHHSIGQTVYITNIFGSSRPNEVFFESIKTGLTGRDINGVIVIDDYLKSGDRIETSKNNLELIKEKFLTTIINREGGINTACSIIIIATKQSNNDLNGMLTKDPYNWPYLKLSAICEQMPDPNNRNIGDPLWPELFPIEKLEKVKRMYSLEPWFWELLYQGNLVSKGERIFESRQFYNSIPIKIESLPITIYGVRV